MKRPREEALQTEAIDVPDVLPVHRLKERMAFNLLHAHGSDPVLGVGAVPGTHTNVTQDSSGISKWLLCGFQATSVPQYQVFGSLRDGDLGRKDQGFFPVHDLPVRLLRRLGAEGGVTCRREFKLRFLRPFGATEAMCVMKTERDPTMRPMRLPVLPEGPLDSVLSTMAGWL